MKFEVSNIVCLIMPFSKRSSSFFDVEFNKKRMYFLISLEERQIEPDGDTFSIVSLEIQSLHSLQR